ncbi:hypothetical protein [Streptomyces sp. NPDC059271]|uniref:hypothetical protein n=1 Tax=Streptomyces sp. NPDC059271 TaxID=3346799 RepID=UPI0036C832A2
MSTHLEHRAVDGIVTDIPDPHYGIAAFTLTQAPDQTATAPRAPGAAYACITGVPHVTEILERDVQPGALVRVDGITGKPSTPGGPIYLTVTALRVLTPAPNPPGMTLHRHGDYLTVIDDDADTVPVFTADGAWVGAAPDVADAAALIQRHQQQRAEG